MADLATADLQLIADHLVAAEGPLPVAALWSAETLAGVDVGGGIEALVADGRATVTDREVVTSDPAPSPLTELGRARLRGAIGRSLREARGVDSVRVASMLLDGLLASPDPTVIPWVLDRAEQSLRDGALPTCAALLEAAAHALDEGLPASAATRLRVLGRLSFVWRFMGRATDADALLDRCADVARESGDPIDIAIAAVVWSPRTINVSDDPRAAAYIDGALRGLPDDEYTLRSRVLTERANALLFTDLARSQESAADAVMLARHSDDPDSVAAALTSFRITHWHPSRQHELLEVASELVTVGPRTTQYVEYGTIFRLGIFLELGDFEHFDNELAALGRRLERARRPVEEVWYHAAVAIRAIIQGRWSDAIAASATAMTIGNGVEYGSMYQLVLTQQLLVAWHRGEDLMALVDDDVSAGPLMRSWQAGLLGWTCTRRPNDEVVARLDEHLVHGLAGIRNDLTFGPVASSLAIAASHVASVPHAGILYDAMAPFAEQWAGTGGAVSNGPYALHLGTLAMVLGDHAAAVAHLDHAAASCSAAGAVPFAARVEVARARLLGPDAGKPHAAEAARLAESVEMAEVLQTARSLIGSAAHPAGLSDREVEVLQLLADGLTNKAIADTLFLSVKTVERHLLNAYRKIEARGRAEATAFVLRSLR